jgi:hypothetical protein
MVLNDPTQHLGLRLPTTNTCLFQSAKEECQVKGIVVINIHPSRKPMNHCNSPAQHPIYAEEEFTRRGHTCLMVARPKPLQGFSPAHVALLSIPSSHPDILRQLWFCRRAVFLSEEIELQTYKVQDLNLPESVRLTLDNPNLRIFSLRL